MAECEGVLSLDVTPDCVQQVVAHSAYKDRNRKTLAKQAKVTCVCEAVPGERSLESVKCNLEMIFFFISFRFSSVSVDNLRVVGNTERG